ncbi:MAG: LPXTG cell wall anchor domain-containing protein [Eubacteriales bacterium]|nr:LPXTG cell wall anchor domain-containing protein [Eubacteriales bacterium]
MKRKTLKKMCGFFSVFMAACSIAGAGIYAEEVGTESAYVQESDSETVNTAETLETPAAELQENSEEFDETEEAGGTETAESDTQAQEFGAEETGADETWKIEIWAEETWTEEVLDTEAAKIVDESVMVNLELFSGITEMNIADTLEDAGTACVLTFIAGMGENVSFTYVNGTEGQTILDACGGALPAGPAPANGKVFAGWVDNGSGNVIDGSEMVTGDMVFGAKLTACAHAETTTETVTEANCTEAGKENVICQICGTPVAENEIPALGHSANLVEAKEPTAEAPGNIAYYQCSRCGLLFADEACTKEITQQDTVLEFKEYTLRFFNPETQTNMIYTAQAGQTILEACGGAMPAVKKEGMIFDAWIESDSRLPVSGNEIVTADMDFGARFRICDHPEESVTTAVTIPATCVEAGKATKTCQACGKAWEEEIEATGIHTFGEWTVVKEATKTEKGIKERTCSMCQLKETEEIPVVSGSETETEPGGNTDDQTETNGGNTGNQTETDDVNTDDQTETNGGDIDDQPETEKVSNTGSGTGTGTSTGNNASGTGTGSASGTGTPNTGDNTNVFGWVLALLVSGGCVLGLRRKKAAR